MVAGVPVSGHNSSMAGGLANVYVRARSPPQATCTGAGQRHRGSVLGLGRCDRLDAHPGGCRGRGSMRAWSVRASTFSAATSSDGVHWNYLLGSTVTLSVSVTMLAGLAVTSHSTTTAGTATFHNPAPSRATQTASYTVWCGGTAAQSPCTEVDRTQRLNDTTTATSRAFYDGMGHPVETRSPAPGGHDVVRDSLYDVSQGLTAQSMPYLVTAYTGGPGAAAIRSRTPASRQTSYSYHALGRTLVTRDALSIGTTRSHAGYAGSRVPTRVANIDKRSPHPPASRAARVSR
jgi:YD repeat-containing protein